MRQENINMFNSNVESQTSDSQCPSPRFALQLSHVTFQKANFKPQIVSSRSQREQTAFFFSSHALLLHRCTLAEHSPQRQRRRRDCRKYTRCTSCRPGRSTVVCDPHGISCRSSLRESSGRSLLDHRQQLRMTKRRPA